MDGQVIIGTKLDTKDFDAEIKYIERQLDGIEDKLKQADMGFEVGDVDKLEAQYSKLSKQLDRLNQKQAQLNRADLSKVQDSIESVGVATSKVIKKVGKWALAVFGVRSAYIFIRQSASTLAEYNDQIASDLEYIRFALASVLQPVVENLIKIIYTLLTYVNYIAKAWFNVDLFANASAKAMQKGSRAAEKMKKSLAGFDEMNVLNSNGSSGALGSVSPSVDLTLEPTVDEGFKKIADKIIGIKGIIETLQEYLNDPQLFDDAFGNWGKFIYGCMTLAEGFFLAIRAVFEGITGLLKLLVGVFLGDEDMIKSGWKDMSDFLLDTILAVTDLMIAALDMVLGFLKGIFLDIFDGLKRIFKIIWGFFKDLFNKIMTLFKNIGFAIGKAIYGAIKLVINSAFAILEKFLNVPIKTINGLLKVINKALPESKEISKISTIKLPRLAKGGIINMPNRGIPVGSAIAGESGREGVLPLTNSQAMMELGREIGKYITINANITNSMNGRVISRELQRVANDSDFAFNR